MSERIQYRPEIDGLRAVAVLTVVLYHFHVGLLRGGFVGVDVFFVISGFLITSIILDELSAGEFSLVRFYERRARRILPALTVVCLAAFTAGLLWLFPGDLIELGKSEAATALFSANIFFRHVTGYFALNVQEKPLLHTWSLGVEEQFYLVFPLLLMLLHKIGGGWRTIAGVALLGALSFGASIWAVKAVPSSAFYLTQYRFWELALGGLLAAVPTITKHRQFDDLVVGSGLAVIIVAATTFSKHTIFPGAAALLPCAGAALVIAGGAHSQLAKKALANRPMRFIGQMSYSIYLWHWPLQAFARIRFNNPLEGHGAGTWSWCVGLFALTLILSYLSWRFVEQPARQKGRFTRLQVFTASGAALTALCILGGAVVWSDGLPARMPPDAVTMAGTPHNFVFPQEDCMAGAPDTAPEGCTVGPANAPVRAAIWGDSHAGALAPALIVPLTTHNERAIVLEHFSCPAFGGVEKERDAEFSECPSFNASVRDYLTHHPQITDVVLAGRWAAHGDLSVDGSKNDALYRGLAETVDGLRAQGRHVFIIASVPEPGFDVPRCLSRRTAFGPRWFTCPVETLQTYDTKEAATLTALKRVERKAAVFYPTSVLCQTGDCALGDRRAIYYIDNNHASIAGARVLAAGVSGAFKDDWK